MEQCPSPSLGISAVGLCESYIFMWLLDEYIRNHTEISGLCERVKPKVQPDAIYDFIVIGGGSGGATVAGRLAQQKKWTVLLIEAGPDELPALEVPSLYNDFLGNPQLDWNYKSERQHYAYLGNPGKTTAVVRPKVLGGCSSLNGMMYTRPLSEDFDLWVKDGNPRWSFKETMKFYLDMEDNQEIGSKVEKRFHGVGGPLTVARYPSYPKFADSLFEAARETGYPVSEDLNGVQKIGFARAQMTQRNGTRLSASKAFLWPENNNPYFHVMLNTTAVRIGLNSTKSGVKRGTSVLLVYNGQNYEVKVRKEIIVAGGAINSPQILMLSGIGPKKHLKSVGINPVINLPGVGENLHNHVAFPLLYALKKIVNTNDLDWFAANEYFKTRRGPMSSTGLQQITARLNTQFAPSNGQWPDLQLFFYGFTANCGATSDNSTYKTFGIRPVVLRPKSRGKIQLKSNIFSDKPLLKIRDLQHPHDVKTLVAGIRIIQRFTNSSMLREKFGIELIKDNYGYCSDKYAFDSDDFWGCAVRYATSPENHYAGTCKMGPATDGRSVVNEELMVHHTSNIRVMDSSVFPYSISGNPAATVMMVAERGVHDLINRYA